MLVRFTKNTAAAKVDAIACVRPDGNMTSDEMPRRGILPHEAFHFVVESTLEWRTRFSVTSRGEDR